MAEAASYQLMVIWHFASNTALDALSLRDDFLASLQKHAGPNTDLFAAKVVFTELVANVVLHAPGPIAILLEVDNSGVILTVTDTGPGFVFDPALPHSVCDGGRGMFLISRCAAAVSVKRLDGAGTSVSAILGQGLLD